MQRVKNIEYDAEDLCSDEDNDYAEQEQRYTAEDRNNFATLTPVVRVELDEAGLQASDREIEEALWHYYWDVGKSVAYLRNTRTPRPQQVQQEAKKEKPKSKFDQAAERTISKAGKWHVSFATAAGGNGAAGLSMDDMGRRGGSYFHPWFTHRADKVYLRPGEKLSFILSGLVSRCTLVCSPTGNGRCPCPS